MAVMISTCASELVVPFCERFGIRTPFGLSRNHYLASLKPLESVHEHGPIELMQNISADLNNQVWAYAEDVAIERGMVELAQR